MCLYALPGASVLCRSQLKREEPLSKRLRQDTYADGHRPSLPTGEEEVFAPARSPLLPGEKLEVTFYSDEAWIGAEPTCQCNTSAFVPVL